MKSKHLGPVALCITCFSRLFLNATCWFHEYYSMLKQKTLLYQKLLNLRTRCLHSSKSKLQVISLYRIIYIEITFPTKIFYVFQMVLNKYLQESTTTQHDLVVVKNMSENKLIPDRNGCFQVYNNNLSPLEFSSFWRRKVVTKQSFKVKNNFKQDVLLFPRCQSEIPFRS